MFIISGIIMSANVNTITKVIRILDKTEIY